MTWAGWISQPAILPWAALFFGLCVGSFLNVVIHRLPRMMEREWLTQGPEALEEAQALKGNAEAIRLASESRALINPLLEPRLGLVLPRSHCPHCGGRISALQNIPVISYLALRGKCARCATPISLRYPIIELLAGLGAVFCALHFGGSNAKVIAAMLFFWSVLALAVIDHETGLLPDDITLPLLWVGLLFNTAGAFVPLQEAVIGAAAGYLVLWSVNAIFRAIRGIEGMGYGDFKMTAAVGAFLGWKALLMIILLSSAVGVVFGTAQMFAAKRGWDWKFRFHFGPYIAIAGLVTMFWGDALAQRFPSLRPFG
jgi:leader peptidase (prepilin peptidase) / N-methyltransferase